MKRKFLFTALITMILASCSNDDVVSINNSKEIFFRTSLDKNVTRANETSLANLGTFKVTAIGNGKSLFDSVSVTSTDAGKTWHPKDTYLWPNYELEFFAYSPKEISKIATINNASKQIIGFTPASDVKAQKDLVISYNRGNRTNNENTGVAMNFKHALSQIEIKAKCGNNKIKVRVLGVKVANVATQGNFTFPQNETNTNYILSQNTWSDLAGNNDHSKAYMIRGNNTTPIILNDTAQSLMFGDDNFMLLPQKLEKWDGTASTKGAYLSVLCRITSLNGQEETLLFPSEANKYGFTAVGIDTNWEPGKKYIYTLEFCAPGGGGGKTDPNPVNPTDPTDPYVDPTPDPGKSVLGKPIKFTVTVDEWKDGDTGKDIPM